MNKRCVKRDSLTFLPHMKQGKSFNILRYLSGYLSCLEILLVSFQINRQCKEEVRVNIQSPFLKTF